MTTNFVTLYSGSSLFGISVAQTFSITGNGK
jgi:hypothetical protein